MYTIGWARGAYQCLCRAGYYSTRHPDGFNGTIMEVAYLEYRDNQSSFYGNVFRCQACAPGCAHCTSPAPCLATYNWAFRMSLLIISVLCAFFTLLLTCYMYRHRKVKVFKVASPIFLTITLLGCAIMYLEVWHMLRVHKCMQANKLKKNTHSNSIKDFCLWPRSQRMEFHNKSNNRKMK